MKLPCPPLLVISDRLQAKRPLLEVAAAVFAAGGRWFSLREKDLPVAERLALLRALLPLARRHGARLTVHDDIAAAVETRCDGVHLPGGADPAAVRRLLPDALIGASAHTPEEAAAKLRAGADYTTLSPIFLTSSKPGYGPALGLDTLAAAARLGPGPIVALGGLNATNIAACFAAGAKGIAVMGEIMRAADPAAETRNLLAAVEAAMAAREV